MHSLGNSTSTWKQCFVFASAAENITNDLIETVNLSLFKKIEVPEVSQNKTFIKLLESCSVEESPKSQLQESCFVSPEDLFLIHKSNFKMLKAFLAQKKVERCGQFISKTEVLKMLF